MLDLRDHHIRLEPLYEINGIAVVGRLPNYLHLTPARGEHGGNALPEHGVVVNQDNAYCGVHVHRPSRTRSMPVGAHRDRSRIAFVAPYYLTSRNTL